MFLLEEDYWQIKKTRDKGYGVFAKKKISAGTVIGDYLGKVINIAQYDLDKDKYGLYLLYLTDKAAVYPDLKKPGIHLINHSCTPNCWIYTYYGHTLFFALRDIKPNEELTITYLLSPRSKNCIPCTHACKCSGKFCTGTMHLSEEKYKIWQDFQNKNKKKAKKVNFIVGRNLTKLLNYPKTIPNNPIYAIISSPEK